MMISKRGRYEGDHQSLFALLRTANIEGMKENKIFGFMKHWG